MTAARVAAWLAAGALLGCGADARAAEHDHSAMAHDAPPATTGALLSAADVDFLMHMIVHHQQAVELTALVPARSSRDEFRRFARYLDGAQQGEIDQMRELLQLAAARGVPTPEAHLHGDPPMAGMLSRAQLAAIERARGAEFERLWLEGMIVHHEAALAMARAQQEAQFRSGHQPYGLDVLVDSMLDVQRGEVTRMRGWLSEWR